MIDRRKIIIGECLGLVLVVGIILYLTPALDWLNLRVSDAVYKVRAAPSPSSDIIIVSADGVSEAELGEFGLEWRSYHGRIIEAISQGHPKVIGFDFCFEESTEYDEEFARSIQIVRTAGTAVVVGTGCSLKGDDLVLPAEPIRSQVSAWGRLFLLVNEGTVRKTRVITGDENDGLTPSFDLLLMTAGKAGKEHIDLVGGKVVSPSSGFSSIPVDSKGFMLINFAREGGRFRRYSYIDVLGVDFPSEVFKDGIVLIGGEVEKLGKRLDYFSTPVESMYGLEVHANVINTIRQNAPIRSLDGFIINALIVIALGIIAIWLSIRSSIWGGIALTVLEAIVFVGVSLILMRSGLMIGIVNPLVIIFLSSGGVSLYQFIMTREEIAQTQGLKPEVLEKLKRDKGLKKGIWKRVTILYSDIRGWTEFTQKSGMEQAHILVSEYLETMEEIVYKNGGYVMKYIGDAVMAVFGYPLGDEDQSKNALRCALDMQRSFEKLQDKWNREGVSPFSGIGIGIDTGDVIFSMMGGGRRIQFDVIGDTANYAARLEGLTKDYSHPLLISEETYKEVKDIVIVSPDGVLENVVVNSTLDKK